MARAAGVVPAGLATLLSPAAVERIPLRVRQAAGFAALAVVVVILLNTRTPIREMGWSVVRDNVAFFARGIEMSLALTATCLPLGLALGVLLGTARAVGPLPLRWMVAAVIEGVRAVPQVMVIFWVFFTLPIASGQSLSPLNAARVSLTLIIAAYLAEVVRAGIGSVPRGQVEAALSTGLTLPRVMRHVVLPQAVRNMLPAVVAQAVALLKTTSLVSVIGVMEFFRSATVVNSRDFAPFAIFTFVALVYYALCSALSGFGQYLERRVAIPGHAVHAES